MARVEMRKPISSLMDEKSKLDLLMTALGDRYTRWQTELAERRANQFAYREGKNALSNSNSSKPARKVFDEQIAAEQLALEKCIKELDLVEKERVAVHSKLKAIEKSIKELQNA